jgi:phosphoheptose isomerase
MLGDAEALSVARDAWSRSSDAKRRVGDRALQDVVAAARLIADSLASGGKVLLCGNGGSAADAQHIAAELTGRYVIERPGMAGIALTTDTSALTAIGNDYGYERVFSRQVEALGRAGDVLVGISTSGGSPNVVAALEVARSIGMQTVALTGARDSRCAELADVTLRSPDVETARIQECHIFFGHVICELLDASEAPAAVAGGVFTEWNADLSERRARWRERGLRVVLTNGAFDLLHVGHLTSLEDARRFGDVLVVAVNADDTVRRQKGDDRPARGEVDRLRLVAALDVVDAAVLFHDDDASPLINWLQPDVWVKGGDYAARDRATMPEVAAMERIGGRVEFVSYVDGQSTTSTIERIRGR